MVAATCTPSPHAKPASVALDCLFWAVLTFFVLQCLGFAWFGYFPNPYDEAAHFSFALHVLQTGDLLPAFADLRLVDPEAVTGWTDRPNYLNHPSGYYALMAAAAAPFELPPADLIRLWRLLNVALAAAVVALILRLGRDAGWSAPAQAAFAVLVALNPALPVLGSIVSNDNLAFLGGALTCLGAFRLLSGKRSAGVWMTAAAGVLLAGLAKLTAVLLCGLLLAGTLAWLIASEGPAVLRSASALLCLVIAALGLAPYLLFLLHHGSAAPFTAGQAAILESRLAEIPAWRDSRLDFWPYVGHFARSLLVYWSPVTPIRPPQVALLALPAIVLGVSVIAVLAALRPAWRGIGDPTARFVVGGAAAMAVMAAVHLEFTFARHQETGWLRGVYPRYYFPLLAVLPAACAWLIERCGRPSRRWALAGLLIAATAIYYLLHRRI
jgi:hypothetical protein